MSEYYEIPNTTPRLAISFSAGVAFCLSLIGIRWDILLSVGLGIVVFILAYILSGFGMEKQTVIYLDEEDTERLREGLKAKMEQEDRA